MKKKLLGLIASAGIALSYFSVVGTNNAKGALADGAAFNSVGSGTKNDPWKISSKEQWESLAESVNTSSFDLTGKYLALTQNISGVSTTVGNKTNRFKGNLDGGNFTISYELKNGTFDCAGLFSVVDAGASVKNLTVSGTISGSAGVYSTKFGGICGVNYGEIDNCTSNVNIVSGGLSSSTFGGICGENNADIKNSVCYGQITAKNGDSSVGGIAGKNTGNILKCKNLANYLSGFTVGDNGSKCGCIVGENTGLINDVYNEQILASASGTLDLGGIVGFNSGDIYNAINHGSLQTSGSVSGGVVGNNTGKIYNSVNNNIVQANNGSGTVGGFFGFNGGKIYNSVNYISVVSQGTTVSVGGFGGNNGTGSEYQNCYCVSSGAPIIAAGASYTNIAKVSEEQAVTNYNVVYSGEDKVQDGKALLEILNEYIDKGNATITANCYRWTKTKDTYPTPTSDTYKVTIGEHEHGKFSIYSNYVKVNEVFMVIYEAEVGYDLTALTYNAVGSANETDILLGKKITMPAADIIINSTLVERHVCAGTLVKGQEADCFNNGFKDYYACSCGKYYSDAACDEGTLIGSSEQELERWKKSFGKVPKVNHFTNKVDGEEATATSNGYKECYVCRFCGTFFEDEDQLNEIGDDAAYQAWKVGDGKVVYTKSNSSTTMVIIIVAAAVGALLVAYVVMGIVYKNTGKGIGFLIPTFKIFGKPKKQQKVVSKAAPTNTNANNVKK